MIGQKQMIDLDDRDGSEKPGLSVQNGSGETTSRSPAFQKKPGSAAAWFHQHRFLFGLSIVAVALSLAMVVRSDGRVALRGLERYPLPETCGSRQWLGVECPGCGLTRSMIYLAQGRFVDSLRLHRLGWLMALAIVLQIPYRGYALWSRRPHPLGRRGPRLFGRLLFAALVLNWISNQIAL
ncbi:MAG: DUF2752 domain-containing protein [Planctomycetaceae bacterium]